MGKALPFVEPKDNLQSVETKERFFVQEGKPPRKKPDEPPPRQMPPKFEPHTRSGNDPRGKKSDRRSGTSPEFIINWTPEAEKQYSYRDPESNERRKGDRRESSAERRHSPKEDRPCRHDDAVYVTREVDSNIGSKSEGAESVTRKTTRGNQEKTKAPASRTVEMSAEMLNRPKPDSQVPMVQSGNVRSGYPLSEDKPEGPNKKWRSDQMGPKFTLLKTAGNFLKKAWEWVAGPQ